MESYQSDLCRFRAVTLSSLRLVVNVPVFTIHLCTVYRSVSDVPVYAPTTSFHSINSLFSPSITPSLLHSRLNTYLFHKSFPPSTPSGLTPRTLWRRRFFWASRLFVFLCFFVTLFWLVPCGRLSWLFVSVLGHVNIAYRIASYCNCNGALV